MPVYCLLSGLPWSSPQDIHKELEQKLAAFHGINFQELAGLMTGMGESYREMMVGGGRSIEGNRYKSEWEDE